MEKCLGKNLSAHSEEKSSALGDAGRRFVVFVLSVP